MKKPATRPTRSRHRLRPTLTLLEDRQLLSTIIVDNPTDTPSVGFTDLREAVAQAVSDADDDVISFDPSVFGTPQTINLTLGAIDLTKATGSLTIDGPGAGLLSVSGGGVSGVFSLNSGVVALSGLTVTGAADLGAVTNLGGTATLTDCVLSGNNDQGGAVFNATLNGTLIPTTTLTDCTVSNNVAGFGGGVTNIGGLLTMTGCTVSGNQAIEFGGGLQNGFPFGGFPIPSTMVLTNCTISGNSAGYGGGGLFNSANSSASLTGCTVSGNSAPTAGGLVNIDTTTLVDSIVSGNTATNAAPDAYGAFTSLGHNLIGAADGGTGWVASDLTGTDASPLNALLAPLGNYGGPTQTMPPLPGSPAIAAGDTSLIPSGVVTDQRGLGRTLNGAVDIGAAQTQGFTLAATGGTSQTAPVNTAFTDPLAVSVSADDGVDPVDGGLVTFAAPTSDPTAILSASTAVVSGGVASVTATATGTIGAYSVTANAVGADGPATFNLGNAETPSLVVNTAGDVSDPYDSLTTLREAVAYAQSLGGDETVTFDPSVFSAPTTITLTSGEMNLSDTTGTLTIDGPGADVLSISGNNSGRVFTLNGGAAALSGLTITGGSTPYGGAALSNADGTASLSHVIISGNSSGYGAVTTSDGGTTALVDCTVSNNAGTYGGGVANLSNGTTTLDGCTIKDNTAYTGGGLDNGYADFYVSGASMVLTNCTISGNTATYGGGMLNSYDNTATLTNCTISGNHASSFGGFLNQNGSTATLDNCTISGNSADSIGGICNGNGTLYLANTIVAGNSASSAPDAFGDFVSRGNNLIGGADDSTGWTASDLRGTDASPLNPRLAPLGDYGGSTQSMPVLPGSPALGAGNTALIPDGATLDQRGLPRVVNGHVDIGAAESQGYTLTVTGGDGQSTVVTFGFANPLTVSVASNNPDDPVDGGVILFTAPASGASATLSPAVITGGSASANATANATLGTYTVTATANGFTPAVSFSLTNATGSLVVNTTSDVLIGYPGVTTLREAIASARALPGDQTITFDPSVFSTPQTITLTAGELLLNDTLGNVTIAGPGANLLSVSGNNASRVFDVFGLTGGVNTIYTVTLSGLTITNGAVNGFGGGVYNNGGILTLADCTISNNKAFTGGGVCADRAATTTFTGCTISNNTATSGGGVVNAAATTATFTDCTISNNTGNNCGGVFNTLATAVTFTHCTISANTTINNGGGVFNNGVGTATFTDCTISNNTARASGGGVINAGVGTATFTDCTIRDNTAGNGGGAGNFNGTTTTFTDCTISNNTATVSGGGVVNQTANVTFTNSTISNNKALSSTGLGGGVINAGVGTATFTDCTISNNTASGSAGGGGGVCNAAVAPGTLTLTDCTVSNNTAKYGGGVLALSSSNTNLIGCSVVNNTAAFGAGLDINNTGVRQTSSPSVTLTDCTVSGNNATTQGGALINGFVSGALTALGATTLVNCTVSGNSAPTGGGLDNVNGTVSLANTILAGNTASTAGPDAVGAFTSSGHNLIGAASDSVGWVASDLTGTDASPLNALLAPLGNYGGPAQTMPPLPGSPAIAAGDTTLVPNGVVTDQRGLGRTLNSTVDIGAVETQGYTLTVTGGNSQTALGVAAFANPLAVSISPSDANDPVNGGVITFTAPASGASAALSPSNAVISGGAASATATANGTPGAYNVSASAAGANSVAFGLANFAQPAFTGLTSATSTYGSSVTFTGKLAAGTVAATGSVTVTISGNGITAITKPAALDASGHFSATLNTAALPANPTSPYTVIYAYTAQNNFLAASDHSTTLTVNQAGLTVTAAGTTILVGQPVPSLTYTYTGLVNGDTSATFIGGLTTAATGTPAAGSYSVTQGTLAATGNYRITTFVAGTLTVVGSGVTLVGTKLYVVGGATSNDQVTISPSGGSNTGSTGVQVQTRLNGVNAQTTYGQPLTGVIIALQGGNETVTMASTLTIPATVTAGNGNNTVQLGGGNNTVTLGNGNDKVTAGNGNNTVTLGSGNDTVQLGDGTNKVTAGATGSQGNIQVELGDGANNLVTLLGDGNNQVQAGNGAGDVVTITGNGNNQIQLGNGYGDSASITGNGNNQIQLGNGYGCSVTMVGNGNNSIETGTGSGTVHVAGTGKKKVKLGSSGWKQV